MASKLEEVHPKTKIAKTQTLLHYTRWISSSANFINSLVNESEEIVLVLEVPCFIQLRSITPSKTLGSGQKTSYESVYRAEPKQSRKCE